MAPQDRLSLLKWGFRMLVRMLVCVGIAFGLYVGGYVILMRRDLPAMGKDGKFAYRSSFWLAPSVTVPGPTTVWPTVSPLNVFFKPVDDYWRRICGYIDAIPENEPFAAGLLDAGTITGITVFLNPPEMSWAEKYEDLARCRRVEVDPNGAAQELCQALSGRHTVRDKDAGGTTVAGTIQAVVDGGKSVFLYFDVAENSDVYVFHPGSPAQEPRANGHGQNDLLAWLKKYVLVGEAP